MNYNWNWKVFWDMAADGTGTWGMTLFYGVLWSLATAFCAGVIAFLLGSMLGVMRTTPNKWAVMIGNAYVELFRNIPLLVQLFLWFFVLPELLPKALGTAIKQMPPPWASFVPAVIGLGLFTAARVSEQVKAGIQSLPRGQFMAGTALGLTLPQSYRFVVLPMAFRVILPPLTSETMNLIKNTSVALTIGLLELTAAARSLQEFTFQVFEAFTAATLIYIAVNLGVVTLMRWLEKSVSVPGFIGHVPAGGAH
ncbi:MAG: amino acid ABC transporter permease [Betaproteobacteria bacterium]